MARFAHLGCVLLAVGLTATTRADTVYTATTGLSVTSNPNGPWTFGYRPLGYGTFSKYTVSGKTSGADGWWTTNSAWNGVPGAYRNGTAATIPYWGGTVNFPTGMLLLHPGPQGQYSIIRFTVPVAGNYRFAATFTALARDGGTAPGYSTTTDVHFYKNGVELYGANFNVPLGGTLYSGRFTQSLAVNDTIEVAVGRGSNGTYYSDSTGVDFTITQFTTKSFLNWHQEALEGGGRSRLARIIARAGSCLNPWASRGRHRRLACATVSSDGARSSREPLD